MTISYKNMTVGDPKRDSDDAKPYGTINEGWWECDSKGQAMVRAATALKTDQEDRSRMNLLHARLYGNNDLVSFSGRTYNQSILAVQSRIAINVVASAIDTLASKISKSKPRPSFQTAGGSWQMQQKAQKLNSFMEGVNYEADTPAVARLAFLSACVFGTGAIKAFLDPATGRIRHENTFVDDLFVDELDGKYGKPRQLFQRALVPRSVLCDMFGDDPEAVEAINAAQTPFEDSDVPSARAFSDRLEVWEGWHLRSGAEANDGVHCMAINGYELMCEEWKMDSFPFAFLRYNPRVLGFWGQGAAERLTGIQVSINRTIKSIDEQMRRKGKGRIFLPIGSKIVPTKLSNGIAEIIHFLGQPPIVDNNNAVASEDFMYLDSLIQKAFQEVGVSQLSATMKKPAGLDAQVALREFTDIESERFALLSLDWDKMHLDLAEIDIFLVASSGGKGYKVRLPNKRYVVDIDWKDINLKRDDFVMQMFPVSSLPAHPGARYQRVKEMYQDGVIDLATFKKLMDFPDLKAASDLGNAAMDDVSAVIGYILDDAEPHYEPPDQYQNLELMVSMATASLLYAKHHGADEERLSMLRRLIDEASALQLQASQAAMPPPVPGGPGPGGPMPMGAPVSQSQTVNVPTAPTVPPIVGG